MSYTNYPNGLTSFGVPLTGSLPLVLGSTGAGKIYFVDATNGVDGNSGLSTDQALKTIPAAVALAVSGDTIALSSNATHNLTTELDVTKSRINFIGMDFSGRQVQQGAKVQLAGNIVSEGVMTNAGVRNSYVNIKFIQGSTNAASVRVATDFGEGTLWDNCSFVFGVNNNLGSTSSSEFTAGCDSCTFVNCTFGSDTLLTTAARQVFNIKSGNTEFKSNILQNCNFIISSSSSTATFVRLNSISDILFTNLFKDCTFVASVDSAGGVAIAEASQTATGTVKGGLYYVRPACFNVTDFSTATSGHNANTQVVAAVSVAAAIEGIKPTA